MDAQLEFFEVLIDVGDPGHLDQNAVFALNPDARLGQAEGIDPALDGIAHRLNGFLLDHLEGLIANPDGQHGTFVGVVGGRELLAQDLARA